DARKRLILSSALIRHSWAFARALGPAAAALALACGRPEASPAAERRIVLRGPGDSLIPDGPLGTSIRRGRALLAAARDRLTAHVGNRLRCVSCHLDDGRRQNGSWVGVYVRYPQYRSRSATVETIEYRVNDCFRRSMNGVALASDGPDMRDIVTYFWFLARDVPVAPVSTANRLAKWATFVPDTSRGAGVDVATCA